MLDNFDANTAITKTDTTSAGNGAGQKVDLESGGEALSSAKPVQKTVKEHVINLICDGMYLYTLEYIPNKRWGMLIDFLTIFHPLCSYSIPYFY